MPPAKRTKKKAKAELSAPEDRQRIDRWLWHARIVKTRTLAASLVASGHVRVNGRRAETSAHAVRKNDMLTIALFSKVRVLRVVDFAGRRGDAALAATLYEEIKA
jgi:ribosome-associated heat shock protein Hsp15